MIPPARLYAGRWRRRQRFRRLLAHPVARAALEDQQRLVSLLTGAGAAVDGSPYWRLWRTVLEEASTGGDGGTASG